MKKLTALFLILCVIVLPVFASDAAYVREDAGLLTAQQVQMLEDTARTFSENHGFGIYIHTLWDYTQSGESDIYDYAVADFLEQGLGYGSEAQGAVLTLSMSDRDYCFIFNGTIGDKAFTETGRDDLERAVLGCLRNSDYYGAFMNYLTVCDAYLTAYEEGKPIGTGTDHSETGYIEYYDDTDPQTSSTFKSIMSAIPGAIAAIVAGTGAAAPMRSAKRKMDATGYGSGLNLTRRQDQFLHRSVTRTPKVQHNSSSGGGGGSIHHSSGSSGSFSGRSGKF